MALEMKRRMKLDATKSLHETRDSVPRKLEKSTILAPERATGLVSHKGENGLQDPRIGAQLLDRKNLKNKPAGKRTCLLPCRSCDVDSVLSFEQN